MLDQGKLKKKQTNIWFSFHISETRLDLLVFKLFK